MKMTNTAQSSRIAGAYNRSLFPEVGAAKIPKPAYAATTMFTQSGESNPQIQKKEKAGVTHYIIGAAVIVALVIYASHKLD
jgi:hypothetical protein